MTNEYTHLSEILEDVNPPTQVLYIAGPMTGIPQFNFPAFIEAKELAEQQGFNVISPVDLDAENNQDYAASFNSEQGSPDDTVQSWGDFLSRDVKIISDQATGILFLEGWQNSKGARLEAYVALACGYTDFYHVTRTKLVKTYPYEYVTQGVRAAI